MRFLSPADISPLAPSLTAEQAVIYIEDVEAQAIAEEPGILAEGFEHGDAVKAILRQAVLRWARAGEGGLSSTQFGAGPFQQTMTVDSRGYGEGRLLASEVRRLKALCRTGAGGRRRAFTVVPR